MVLKKFGFPNVKSVSTPIGQQFRLSTTQAFVTIEDIDYKEKTLYTSVVEA